MARNALFVRSLSELNNDERVCSNKIEQESQDVLNLIEDILDLHLAAMQIQNGHGWSGYDEQAVILLSTRAFHTARAAMIVAKAGYPTEALPLVRVLEDIAEQCRLYSRNETRAKKWLKGERSPSATAIRKEFGESGGDWYDNLGAYVHSRSEAVANYLQRQSSGTMELGIGPDPDLTKFARIGLSIASWELYILAIAASIWPFLNEEQPWAKKFDELFCHWKRSLIASRKVDRGGER